MYIYDFYVNPCYLNGAKSRISFHQKPNNAGLGI